MIQVLGGKGLDGGAVEYLQVFPKFRYTMHVLEDKLQLCANRINFESL